LCGLAVASVLAARGQVIFETTTPYHHIQVIDQRGIRILSFDGSMETKMSLVNPLAGHFEYTEYFHMPWLWNSQMSNVLIVGLGGASTQRSYQHYYPDVKVETVEIDPTVLRVAREYFHFAESPRQKVHVGDGRVFLRRTDRKFDAILMDAYVENRYGSFLPQHLVTKEFFELARSRLPTNGVLAYNVMGSLRGWRVDLLSAVYRTLQDVFPQVYLFPAAESHNVVLVATQAPQRIDFNVMQLRAGVLLQRRRVTLPTFRQRIYSYRAQAPPGLARAPVLTDDFAPVEGLLNAANR
jgi:spermidine synthase